MSRYGGAMTQQHDDGLADASRAGADPRVDDALARLDELPQRPVAEHVELFDDVQRRLREALEEASGEPAADRSG